MRGLLDMLVEAEYGGLLKRQNLLRAPPRPGEYDFRQPDDPLAAYRLPAGAWAPNPKDVRPDGTPKGAGWLGPLKHKSGMPATEIAIGVNIGGKETLIPTLVPTLSPDEIRALLESDADPKSIPRSIVIKAVEHAMGRIKAGQSPFKD